MTPAAFDFESASAGEIARAVQRGVLPRSAPLDWVHERVVLTEQSTHAYAWLDWAGARDSLRTLGADGALTAIPIGIKDLLVVDGMPTGAGSAHPPPVVVPEAPAVAALRGTGALIAGKHRTLEWGLGLDVPLTRTPWAPGRYAGGSTVGGGVSVAVGSCFIAIGTDGAGSIRKPAAVTSTVGFKPTHGLVPRGGLLPGPTDLDDIGWITRTSADAQLVASTFGVLPPGPLRVGRHPRIAVPDFAEVEIDVEVAHSLVHAVRAFHEAQIDVVPFRFRFDEHEAAHHFGVLSAAEGFAQHSPVLAEYPDAYSEAARRRLRDGARITSAQLADAYRWRAALRVGLRQAMRAQRLAALLMPTLPILPRRIDEEAPVTTLPLYTRFTRIWNVTGQPAVSVPVSRAAEGVGLGVQLIGESGGDGVVLALAAALERQLGIQFHVRGAPGE